jgi:hypothetical protein
MRKTYNFICTPTNNFYLDNNPLSSINNATLLDAKDWARILSNCNKDYKQVEFKAVGGRKVYTLEITASKE